MWTRTAIIVLATCLLLTAVPGHRYFGPWNPMPNGTPVDEDDRIAQEHDEAYASAKSSRDIREADWKAIKRFGMDFMSTANFHSLVGGTVLSMKYFVESITGVLYP